jgi:hypothetical protein
MTDITHDKNGTYDNTGRLTGTSNTAAISSGCLSHTGRKSWTSRFNQL